SAQIEKQFGKGSIMRLGSIDPSLALEAISSGSLSLDAALGVGGFPRGRVIEVFGPELSGKAAVALCARAGARHTKRPTISINVPGAEKAHRYRFEIEDMPRLHQPDPRKDRRHVRKSGN